MQKIKLLALDVDGTLTDGKIYLCNSGDELKSFNVKDGLGIKKAIAYGIMPVIITGRQSNIVTRRAAELGIECVYQNIENKSDVLKKLAYEFSLDFAQIAYIGDDENDILAMQICGFKACPADAVIAVKEKCDYICKNNGGEGAVREVIEHLINMDKHNEKF